MNKPKLLSGDQLVHKCDLKNNVSLPEIGLKDVVPNGSWLEQKQTQSALEGRKLLVEAERIEKCGVLSYAVWREDLMLAEVTKQVGGYWHHLGHHMNKNIYLKPEEALYLIEVNCLQLKYNEVTVSLQQAYSLLLRQEISILKYKVYASLSRLGYKVFRYTKPKPTSPDEPKEDESKQDDKTDSHKNTQTLKEDIDVDEKIPDDISLEKNPVENDDKLNKSSENRNVKENSNDVQDTAVNSTIDIDLTQTDTCEVDRVENEADSNLIHDNTDHCDVDGIVKMESSDNQGPVESNHSERTITCDTEAPNKIEENNDCFEHAENANIYPGTSMNSNTNTMNDVNKKHHQRRSRIYGNKYLFKKIKPRDVHKYFKNIPEMSQKSSVIITLPRDHIPDNISSEKTSYEINLKTVTMRQASSPSNDTNNYSETDESTDARRIESSSRTNTPQTNQTPFYASTVRFPRQPFSFNQYHYWRSRHTYNFFPFTNVIYQRPLFRQMFYSPRFNFCPRPQPPVFRQFPPHFGQNTNVLYNSTSNVMTNNSPSNSNTASNNTNSTANSLKRPRDTDPNEQIFRLSCMKRLAFKLKMQQHRRDIPSNLFDTLQTQIATYNSKFTPKVRLTNGMELVELAVVETITLDDNDGNRLNKKARTNIVTHYDEHLNNIKQLAQELKVLVTRHLATPRHRRALSSVVKTFNKSFNADIYIDTNCEVVDRGNIVIVSNSDSDCVIEENKSKKKKLPAGKRLRNPFNVLKRLSEKNKVPVASCSKQDDVQERASKSIERVSNCNKYDAFITKTFSKYWLPTENDFGRAEIPPRNLMLSRLVDSNKQEFIYDFISNQSCKLIDWVHIKVMFLENMEAAAALFQSESDPECNTEFDSIIKPEDCTDMQSVLKKLSIIPNYKEVSHDSSLKIDFDVYNRDVKNLRKSDLPKPHFRIICLNELSGLPTGVDVAALYSNYDRSVPIIFAVVGQSISYLQIKPMDTPMYIPGSDTILED